jgi:chemotaxis protein methyltransferase CheR
MDPSGSIVHGKLEREAFAELREVVLAAGGIDLGLYKDRCVLRRIAVRQRACGATDLRQYLRVVGRDASERERLVKALTIHVSQFFRNPATFDAIRARVLPDILTVKRESGGRAIRVWSAGCACGEEAYSLAILLMESDPRAREHFSFTVYGTDIDPGCLRAAERGAYGPASLAQVPSRWRSRYFHAQEGRFRIVPEIRRLVYFRLHNILMPPPFQRIDLLLFRNVLIYMSESLQRRVVAGLHEAINPGGFLVLGKVESLPEGTRTLFEPVNVAERVYRRLEIRRGHPAGRVSAE